MIFFTIAFCFKIQAIFFLPVIICYLLKGKFKAINFLYFPLTYIIVILPAIILGMPPVYAFTGAYLKQTIGGYKTLCLGIANLYYILPYKYSNSSFDNFALFLTLGMAAIIAYIFVNSKKEDKNQLIFLSYLVTLIVPFLLPHMHERYYYLSDVFALLFAFTYPKYFYIPLISISCSLPSYFNYLGGIRSESYREYACMLMIFCIAKLFSKFIKEFLSKSEE